jgi:MYXO-CTERM domain-containing protein
VLTASEASGLDLWGTRLVVLSACETGVGDSKVGQGVYGLRRAFTLAGAESQVFSLWQVSDNATRALMIDFYTRLSQGEGRTEAMRNAKLALLSRDDRWSHPYFWAAFLSSGRWTPMDSAIFDDGAAPRDPGAGGCAGCRVAANPAPSWLAIALTAFLLAARRRR